MNCKNDTELRMLISWIRKQEPTGSRSIGGYTFESDVDYVATENSVKSLCAKLGLDQTLVDAEKYGDDASISFKYRLDKNDVFINLIVVPSDRELEVWKFATRHCRTFYQMGYIKSKEKRVALFKSFKETYREKYKRGEQG